VCSRILRICRLKTMFVKSTKSTLVVRIAGVFRPRFGWQQSLSGSQTGVELSRDVRDLRRVLLALCHHAKLTVQRLRMWFR
jgi:hypothetical protein